MRSTQRWIAVCAATAGILALAACTPSKGSSGGGTSGGSTGSSGGTSDTLTVAIDTPPDDWNPADASPADPNLL
ncbi:MAG: hypothetical protein J0H43_11950, partial [Actinobacteria bacterium]|nr:hypothetical protein [Actinomycetota bacterium]